MYHNPYLSSNCKIMWDGGYNKKRDKNSLFGIGLRRNKHFIFFLGVKFYLDMMKKHAGITRNRGVFRYLSRGAKKTLKSMDITGQGGLSPNTPPPMNTPQVR